MQLALVVGAICDTKNVVWIQAEPKPQRRHSYLPARNIGRLHQLSISLMLSF